jgi:hypothetical protein
MFYDIYLYTLCYYICCLLGACMRCTRLCPFKTGCYRYGLKRDVASHVVVCDVCQRVKAEHQRPAGLLHPLKVPEWKWEEICMDFIVGLPRTSAGDDSI